MTGKLREIIPVAGGGWIVSFVTRDNPGSIFDALKGVDVSIEIKKASKGRSRDANSFCWAMCSDIGKALKPPVSKEDVYRMAIKAVGLFSSAMITNWDLEVVKQRWESKGTGWFVEVADSAEVGRIWVHLYYGTSVYSADEFRVVLDWLIDQMQQMELPIPLSKAEEEELLKKWGSKNGKQ